MRAFFCIPIPEAMRETIHRTAEHLRSRTRMRASWVPRQNYHVTLRFLGDIDPELTVDLDRLCRRLCNDIAPFECVVNRVGAFPSVPRARVVWAGGEAPPAFRRLSQALSAGLADLAFPRERSESLVHVTLARINDLPDPALSDLIAELNPMDPMTMTVDRIVLMESTLTQRGAIYSSLFATILRGSQT